MFRYTVTLLVGLCAVGTVSASTWATAMFDGLSRDFGSVPRGHQITHPFRLVNNTGKNVHIAGVRVSCGCTSAHVLQNVLEPGQETAVVAQMDTRRFVGTKTVTIFVTFTEPNFEEVRLWVQANSRDDVSVDPNTLAMGRVKRGTAPSAKTTISLLGNNNFRILSVSSETNYVQPLCKVARVDAYEVDYELSASLRADAPPGRWYTDVWLTTNNPAMPRIRIPLTVEIESALEVVPATVLMGTVKANTEISRKIVIRGVEPFSITSVTGGDKLMKVNSSSPEKKTVHVLTLTMRPNQEGDLQRTLQIHTDLRGENTIDIEARAFVVP